jgi:hypothetical protein
MTLCQGFAAPVHHPVAGPRGCGPSHRHRRTPKARIGPAPAMLGLAAALLGAIAAPALAGSCTNATRNTKGGSAKAETTIKNETTGTTLKVQINRNDTQKLDKSIKPGEKASFTAGVKTSAVISVFLYPQDSNVAQTCKYVVSNNTDNAQLHWKLPSDATDVCPGKDRFGFTLTCEKGFASGKDRYHTRFTVSDPQ